MYIENIKLNLENKNAHNKLRSPYSRNISVRKLTIWSEKRKQNWKPSAAHK